MASLNRVTLIGHLGRDPEMRSTGTGIQVANFSIATTDKWTDKDGQKQERTEWHNIVLWKKLAELSSKYLSKGSPVYIEGRLQTRSWDDKDGNKRYQTEVIASSMQFLNARNQDGSGTSSPAASRGGQGQSGGTKQLHVAEDQEPHVADDLPF